MEEIEIEFHNFPLFERSTFLRTKTDSAPKLSDFMPQ